MIESLVILLLIAVAFSFYRIGVKAGIHKVYHRPAKHVYMMEQAPPHIDLRAQFKHLECFSTEAAKYERAIATRVVLREILFKMMDYITLTEEMDNASNRRVLDARVRIIPGRGGCETIGSNLAVDDSGVPSAHYVIDSAIESHPVLRSLYQRQGR